MLVNYSRKKHCPQVVVFPTWSHRSNLEKVFGWKLGKLCLYLNSANGQSLILSTAISPKFSVATKLVIDSC